MISSKNAEALIQASFYFNELYKQTIVATPLPVSVTKTQMDVLMALYAAGPMNMSSLSKHVYIAPEQATRAINGLREKGLIESERSPENRRMVIARLTETGTMMLDDHVRDLRRALQSSLAGLDPSEIKELAKAANSITALFQKTGFKYVVPEPVKKDLEQRK